MKFVNAEILTTVSDRDFDFQINRLRTAFGETRFDESRVARIWKFTAWLTQAELESIADEMIDSFRQIPIPEDFKRMASKFRRKIADTPTVADCGLCLDIGFLRVRFHDDEDSTTLIRCCCERGLRHPKLFIPTWEKGAERVFKRSVVPNTYFGTPLLTGGEKGVTYDDVVKHIGGWMGHLKQAEKFWLARAPVTDGAS